MLSKKVKIGLYIVGGLAVLVLCYIVYRMVWMFDDTATTSAINSQVSGYADPTSATSILKKEVGEILSSQSQTQQVVNYANVSGQAKETVLAQTAYNNAVAKGFLAA